MIFNSFCLIYFFSYLVIVILKEDTENELFRFMFTGRKAYPLFPLTRTSLSLTKAPLMSFCIRFVVLCIYPLLLES